MKNEDYLKIAQFSKRIDWSNGYRLNPSPDEDASVLILNIHTTHYENYYSIKKRKKYNGDGSLGYTKFEKYYGNGHGKHKDYIIIDCGNNNDDFLLISPMRMMILEKDFRGQMRMTGDSMLELREEHDFIKMGYDSGYDSVGDVNKKLIERMKQKTLFDPL